MEVQIKGTRQGLVIYLPPADFEDIKANLHQKLEQARGFFRGARFTFRPAAAPIPVEQQQELEQLVSRYGLIPIKDKPRTVARPVPVAGKAPAFPGLPDAEPAVLVDRSLRSGQDVRCDHGHVVVLGDIHPGARVDAAGSILVMGRCTGTVRAGTVGDPEAVVVALGFGSPMLSIAGVLADDLHTSPGSQTLHTARLKDGKVVLEG
ncbi:MAG: septum site-determining protein MinC [Thermoanaerobacterales bacterium]|nr:septum site-determining protein MinC [Thermoanaerobacterales bacterium]